ncbi:MAG: hypothetical protein ACOY82_11190 [Pseudomonadota bacterium]
MDRRRLRTTIGVALLCALPWTVSARDEAKGDGPEPAVSALWRAMSHAPGERADLGALRRLFHPQAVVFGSRDRQGTASLRRIEIHDFLASFEAVGTDGFHECEIARSVRTHDRFATVYSVVESRTDPAATKADFAGANSLQLYRDDEGWKILSLYYHVDSESPPIAHTAAGDGCLP